MITGTTAMWCAFHARFRSAPALLLAILSFCFAPGQRALGYEVLFDNFFQTASSFDPNPAIARYAYSGGFGGSSGQQYAYAFTPSITATVDQIIMPLDVFNNAQLRGTVALYADNNGLPGTTLMSEVMGFDLPSGGHPGAPNITPFFPSNPPVVQAGQKYWVSVNADNAFNTSIRWYVSTVDFTSPRAYKPGATPWQESFTSLTGAFYVAGTQVPEPASAGILLAILGGCGLRTSRRRQAFSHT